MAGARTTFDRRSLDQAPARHVRGRLGCADREGLERTNIRWVSHPVLHLLFVFSRVAQFFQGLCSLLSRRGTALPASVHELHPRIKELP